MGKIITLYEASELLGICKQTLRRMDRKGELKAITTNGGHRRYDEDDVLRYKNIKGKTRQQGEPTQQEKEAMEIRSFIKDERTLNERIRLEKLRNKTNIKERLEKVTERIRKAEILKKQLEEELKDE